MEVVEMIFKTDKVGFNARWIVYCGYNSTAFLF